MKRFKLLAASGEGKSPADENPAPLTPVNWDLCILCQEIKREVLQCPNESKRPDRGAGYKSFADNLRGFVDLGEVPAAISQRLSTLDEGNGIEAALAVHSAKWHKSCRNLFNKTKLDRALKRKMASEESSRGSDEESTASFADCVPETAERLTRSSLDTSITRCCFICDESDNVLHEVTTFEVDFRVRKCADILQDTKLLAKISAGDLIALEARYHSRCLVGLYNRAAAAEKNDSNEPFSSCQQTQQSLAFAQLVEYIAEIMADTTTAPVFRLSDLVRMYRGRLEQMGITTNSRINSTKLKNRLLAQFPGLTAQSHGKEVLLVCDEHIGNALSTACLYDSDVEAMILTKAAHIVRRDIFSTSYQFAGKFSRECQVKSVPHSLVALMQMILEGPSIDSLHDMSLVPASLSLAQLAAFNSVKHVRNTAQSSENSETVNVRHNISQEKPLPLYIAMMMHAETRKRDLVDKLFHLGLCISYDRLLQISANMANGVCDRFDLQTGISPPALLGGLFTTAAIDNIDHNPGSTTTIASFHGTGISLVQHCTSDEQGTALNSVEEVTKGSKTINPLPLSYSTVTPVRSICKDISTPNINYVAKFDSELHSHGQENWLDTVSTAIEVSE